MIKHFPKGVDMFHIQKKKMLTFLASGRMNTKKMNRLFITLIKMAITVNK